MTMLTGTIAPPRMRTARGRGNWPAVGIALAALVIPTMAGVAPMVSADTASTPEAAVQQALVADGAVYAGDCATTRSPRDVAALCSRLVAEQPGRRAYLVGRTFSEFSRWIFIAQQQDGWRVIGTTPLDFSDRSGLVPWPR